MYTVIRKYDLVPGSVEEFIQQVQKSLVPIINRVPGFREYSLVEVGENEVVAISIFDSLDDAKVICATNSSLGCRPYRAILSRVLKANGRPGESL